MQNNAIYSTMIRSGKTTFFIDVKEAKNGSKYIQISETRLDGDDKKQRSTVRLFADSIEPFRQAIDEACAASQQ